MLLPCCQTFAIAAAAACVSPAARAAAMASAVEVAVLPPPWSRRRMCVREADSAGQSPFIND